MGLLWFGSPRGRFLALTRQSLATARRGAAQYGRFRAFAVETARLTEVQRPKIVRVAHLNFLSFDGVYYDFQQAISWRLQV
jgi:hypothetical protein